MPEIQPRTDPAKRHAIAEGDKERIDLQYSVAQKANRNIDCEESAWLSIGVSCAS